MVWSTPTNPPVRTRVSVSAPDGSVVAAVEPGDAGAEAETAAEPVAGALGVAEASGEAASVAVQPVSSPATRRSASVVRGMTPWCPASANPKPGGVPHGQPGRNRLAHA